MSGDTMTPAARAELAKIKTRWKNFRQQLIGDLDKVDKSITDLSQAVQNLDAHGQLFIMQAAAEHLETVIGSMQTNFGAAMPVAKGRKMQ